MLLRYIKRGFSACSCPVMLISRTLTQDKRVVTDFRHLNVRISKNNLAYPLLKDTFSVLGSSKCEVLSLLNLKEAFHSSRLSENSKKYCGILPYSGCILSVPKDAYGIKYIPFNMAVLHKCDSRLLTK